MPKRRPTILESRWISACSSEAGGDTPVAGGEGCDRTLAVDVVGGEAAALPPWDISRAFSSSSSTRRLARRARRAACFLLWTDDGPGEQNRQARAGTSGTRQSMPAPTTTSRRDKSMDGWSATGWDSPVALSLKLMRWAASSKGRRGKAASDSVKRRCQYEWPNNDEWGRAQDREERLTDLKLFCRCEVFCRGGRHRCGGEGESSLVAGQDRVRKRWFGGKTRARRSPGDYPPPPFLPPACGGDSPSDFSLPALLLSPSLLLHTSLPAAVLTEVSEQGPTGQRVTSLHLAFHFRCTSSRLSPLSLAIRHRWRGWEKDANHARGRALCLGLA